MTSPLIGPHDARYIDPPIGALLKVSLQVSGDDLDGCIGESPWAEVVSDVGWQDGVGKKLRARIDNDPVFTDRHGYKFNDVLEFVLQMNVHSLPMWTAIAKAAH